MLSTSPRRSVGSGLISGFSTYFSKRWPPRDWLSAMTLPLPVPVATIGTRSTPSCCCARVQGRRKGMGPRAPR